MNAAPPATTRYPKSAYHTHAGSHQERRLAHQYAYPGITRNQGTKAQPHHQGWKNQSPAKRNGTHTKTTMNQGSHPVPQSSRRKLLIMPQHRLRPSATATTTHQLASHSGIHQPRNGRSVNGVSQDHFAVPNWLHRIWLLANHHQVNPTNPAGSHQAHHGVRPATHRITQTTYAAPRPHIQGRNQERRRPRYQNQSPTQGSQNSGNSKPHSGAPTNTIPTTSAAGEAG